MDLPQMQQQGQKQVLRLRRRMRATTDAESAEVAEKEWQGV